jgi:hypothetical protein
VEATTTVFVVLTACPVVEGAQVRIQVRNHWPLSAQRRRRHELLSQFEARTFTRREFADLRPVEVEA